MWAKSGLPPTIPRLRGQANVGGLDAVQRLEKMRRAICSIDVSSASEAPVILDDVVVGSEAPVSITQKRLTRNHRITHEANLPVVGMAGAVTGIRSGQRQAALQARRPCKRGNIRNS